MFGWFRKPKAKTAAELSHAADRLYSDALTLAKQSQANANEARLQLQLAHSFYQDAFKNTGLEACLSILASASEALAKAQALDPTAVLEVETDRFTQNDLAAKFLFHESDLYFKFTRGILEKHRNLEETTPHSDFLSLERQATNAQNKAFEAARSTIPKAPTCHIERSASRTLAPSARPLMASLSSTRRIRTNQRYADWR